MITHDYSDLIREIERFKKKTLEEKQHKLKIDFELRKVRRQIAEFQNSQGKRKREFLNELIPVNDNTPELDRKIMTAPENARRPKPIQDSRRILSAGEQLNSAIRESIKALPGFSETLNKPELLSEFRQSYLRDLNDYMTMRKSSSKKDIPVGVENSEITQKLEETIFSFNKLNSAKAFKNRQVPESQEASEVVENNSMFSGSSDEDNARIRSLRATRFGAAPKINFGSTIKIDEDLPENEEGSLEPGEDQFETPPNCKTEFGNTGTIDGESRLGYSGLNYEQPYIEYDSPEGNEAMERRTEQPTPSKQTNIPTFRCNDSLDLESGKKLASKRKDRWREGSKLGDDYLDNSYLPIKRWDRTQDSIDRSHDYQDGDSQSQEEQKYVDFDDIPLNKVESLDETFGTGINQNSNKIPDSEKYEHNRHHGFQFGENIVEPEPLDSLTPNLDKRALSQNEIEKHFGFEDASGISLLKKQSSAESGVNGRAYDQMRSMENSYEHEDQEEIDFTKKQFKGTTRPAIYGDLNKKMNVRFDALFKKYDINDSEMLTPNNYTVSYNRKDVFQSKKPNVGLNTMDLCESDLSLEPDHYGTNLEDIGCSYKEDIEYDNSSEEEKDAVDDMSLYTNQRDTTYLNSFNRTSSAQKKSMASSNLEDEEIELSHGTKNISKLFKNKLGYTSKSNRYGVDVAENSTPYDEHEY